MELTKLKDVEGRMIKNLSKGYKQRVGLAQAILGFPEIIILDEPTVGLDPVQIIEIRDLIKELGKEHTVILSSHILSEIQAVCDYVFIISKGKLVASDYTDKLLGVMSGSQEIKILVKGSKEDVEKVLLDMAQVESVEFEEDYIIVHAKKGYDIREAVFYELAECKMPILEMNTITKSLEDVFIELTQEGGK